MLLRAAIKPCKDTNYDKYNEKTCLEVIMYLQIFLIRIFFNWRFFKCGFVFSLPAIQDASKKRKLREESDPALLSWRSRRPKRCSIPCVRKDPRILASDRTLAQKGTHLLCQMAPLYLATEARGYSLYTSRSSSPLPLTSLLKPGPPNNYSAALASPQIETRGKAREESEFVGLD